MITPVGQKDVRDRLGERVGWDAKKSEDLYSLKQKICVYTPALCKTKPCCDPINMD